MATNTGTATPRTKQNLLENLEKTFPPEVPVYFYCGHGEEVCDPETKEIVVARVPENCIYITVVECGMDSVSTNPMNVLKYIKSPEFNRDIFKKPYLLENKLKLARIMRINPNSIHIHLPGSQYGVTNFTPLGFFYNEADNLLSLYSSGLKELNKFQNEGTLLRRGDLYKQTIPILPETIDKEEFIKKYFHLFRPGFRELYERIAMPALFKNKTTLTKNEASKIFSWSFLTHNEIQDSFEGSVYPTKEEVTKIMTDFFGRKVFYPIEDIYKLDRKLSHTTNTKLMETFPGIHFNLVCRNVPGENCEQGVTRRRASSINQSRQMNESLGYPSSSQRRVNLNTFLDEIREELLFEYNDRNSDITKILNKWFNTYFMYKSYPEKISDYLEAKKELFNIFLTGSITIEKLIRSDIILLKIFGYGVNLEYFLQLLNEQMNLLNQNRNFFNVENKNRLMRSYINTITDNLNPYPITITSMDEKRNIYKTFKENYSDYIERTSDIKLQKLLGLITVAPKSIAPSNNRGPGSVSSSSSKVVVNTSSAEGPGGGSSSSASSKPAPLPNATAPASGRKRISPFDFLMQKINTIARRTYPSNMHKQEALFNSLLASKQNLKELTPQEKQRILDYLFTLNLISKNTNTNTNSSQSLFSLKLKHLIYPEKYATSSGGTRKLRKRQRGLTRKRRA